jgi:hypothetical protein
MELSRESATEQPVYHEASPARFHVMGLFVLVSMLGGFSIDLLQSAEATAVLAYRGLDPHVLSTVQLATQIPAMLLEPVVLKYLGMRGMTAASAALQVSIPFNHPLIAIDPQSPHPPALH